MEVGVESQALGGRRWGKRGQERGLHCGVEAAPAAQDFSVLKFEALREWAGREGGELDLTSTAAGEEETGPALVQLRLRGASPWPCVLRTAPQAALPVLPRPCRWQAWSCLKRDRTAVALWSPWLGLFRKLRRREEGVPTLACLGCPPACQNLVCAAASALAEVPVGISLDPRISPGFRNMLSFYL